jgi:hypothetical protein
MVVLKKGDWCLYMGKRICQVKLLGLNITHVYWTDVEMYGYADPNNLTLLPPELNQILLSSISKGEEHE